mgnify:CR=1 FL=1
MQEGCRWTSGRGGRGASSERREGEQAGQARKAAAREGQDRQGRRSGRLKERAAAAAGWAGASQQLPATTGPLQRNAAQLLLLQQHTSTAPRRAASYCESMRRRMSSGRWLFLMCSTSQCTAGLTPSPVCAVIACRADTSDVVGVGECLSHRPGQATGRRVFEWLCLPQVCTHGQPNTHKACAPPLPARRTCTLLGRASCRRPIPNASATSAGLAAPSQSCLLASTRRGAPYRSRSPAGGGWVKGCGGCEGTRRLAGSGGSKAGEGDAAGWLPPCSGCVQWQAPSQGRFVGCCAHLTRGPTLLSLLQTAPCLPRPRKTPGRGTLQGSRQQEGQAWRKACSNPAGTEQRMACRGGERYAASKPPRHPPAHLRSTCSKWSAALRRRPRPSTAAACPGLQNVPG